MNFKQNTSLPHFSHDVYSVAEAQSEHFVLKHLLPTEHQKHRYARRLNLLNRNKSKSTNQATNQSIASIAIQFLLLPLGQHFGLDALRDFQTFLTNVAQCELHF